MIKSLYKHLKEVFKAMGGSKKFRGMDVRVSPNKGGIFILYINDTFLVYKVYANCEKEFYAEFTMGDVLDFREDGCRAENFKQYIVHLIAEERIRVTDICIAPEVRHKLEK